MTNPEQGRRRRGRRLADGRGLTAVGGVIVVLVLGGLGAALDLGTGSGLRSVFAVTFCAGAVLAALSVHREDLLASVIVPPLVYVLLVLVAGALNTSAGAGSLLVRQALEVVNEIILGAPVLLSATAATILIAVARKLGSRR